jgi:nucleoside-diphosphate-sugar epimerase
MLGRVLVTGATGFLGKNILKKLEEKNIPFIGISKGGSDKVESVDLTNIEEITSFFQNHEVSTVVHASALVDLSRDYQTTIDCVENNLIATINLLEASKNQKNIKFILISSEEVYGANVPPYRESQTPLPPSPYAVSKVACENYLRYFSHQNEINSVVLRMSTMYGPHMPQNKFFSQVIAKALSNEPIPMNSGRNKRDYLFVDDAVDAILKTIWKDAGELFSIINIGNEKSISLSEFVEKVIEIVGSHSVIQYGAIPDRITESDNWFVDLAKARTELSWEPSTTISQGISKTIKLY